MRGGVGWLGSAHPLLEREREELHADTEHDYEINFNSAVCLRIPATHHFNIQNGWLANFWCVPAAVAHY